MRMAHGTQRRWLFLLGPLLAVSAGCARTGFVEVSAEDSVEAEPADAGFVDGTASRQDRASIEDTWPGADIRREDAQVEDARVEDAARSDLGPADNRVDDVVGPDMRPPLEAGPAPDTATPDTATPDTAAPDTAIPDITPPDTNLPDRYSHDTSSLITVAPVYPTLGQDWNNYVRRDAPTLPDWQQSGQACNPDDGSINGYHDCVHAGELRLVEVPQLSTCGSWTAHDELGLFDWTCEASFGSVRFYSQRREGTGLADLVEANGWRANRVTIGEGIYQSHPEQWWQNPVVALGDNTSGPVVLDQQGTIYVVAQDITSDGIVLDAEAQALVTLDRSVINYTGRTGSNTAGVALGSYGYSGYGVVVSRGHNRLWIEAWVHSGSPGAERPNIGIFLRDSRLTRVHNTHSDYADHHALFLYNVRYNLVSQYRSYMNQFQDTGDQTGIRLYNSVHNDFRDVYIEGAQHGFGLQSSHKNRIVDLFVNHSGYYGILFGGSHANVASRLRLSNSSTYGMEFFRTADSHSNTVTQLIASGCGWDGINTDRSIGGTFSHMLSVNNQDNGLWLGRSASAQDNVYVSLVVGNNGDSGLLVNDNGDARNTFYDLVTWANKDGVTVRGDATGFARNLLVGNNLRHGCAVNASNPQIEDGTCTPLGGGAASLLRGVELNSSFVDKLVGFDTVNPAPSASMPASGVQDWFTFDNAYRLWGKQGDSFPAPSNRSRCAGTSDCRIWDWRLRAEDSNPLYQRSHNASQRNQPLLEGQTCPGAVHGDVAITDNQAVEVLGSGGNDNYICDTDETCTPGNTFLVNALEIFDDFSGDDDGLCESYEACIYAPHFGPYQGEGPLVSCNFANGIISGVRMFGYSNDGITPTLVLDAPTAHVRVNLANRFDFVIAGGCTEEGSAVQVSGAFSDTTTCSGGRFSFTHDFSGFADGAVALELSHGGFIDELGLIIDTSIPSVAIDIPEATNYVDGSTQSVFELGGSCSDHGQDVIISGDISDTVTCSGGRWLSRPDLRSLAEGQLNIVVSHDDFAGNGPATTNATYTKDLQRPSERVAPGCLYPPCRPTWGRGNANFAAGVDIGGATDQTEQVELAELNEDGALDLIEVTSISVLRSLGDGAGGFAAAVDISGTFSSNTISLGDFNNDAHIDIVYATYHLNQIALGQGDGTFGALSDIGTETRITLQLVAGDLNGDDRLDLIAINEGADDDIYLGNGDGSFTLFEAQGSADDVRYGALTDFDNDGHLDWLAVTIGPGQMLLPGVGDGSFGNPQTISFAADAALPVLLGNDRVNWDLVAFGHSTISDAASFAGTGGGFNSAQVFISGSSVGWGVGAGFSNDNRLDFAVVQPGAVDRLFLGNWGTDLDDPRDVSLDILNSTYCTAGDLDNDGAVDLVVGVADGPNRVYLGEL